MIESLLLGLLAIVLGVGMLWFTFLRVDGKVSV
jgi:hypothetical protein